MESGGPAVCTRTCTHAHMQIRTHKTCTHMHTDMHIHPQLLPRASPPAPEEDTPAPWQAATEAPDTPGGPRLGELAVTDSSTDSLRLAWTVAQGPFDSFVVQYWDADRQPQALLVGGDQHEVHVSGLEPSTAYKFFLYGLHEGKRLGPVSTEGTTGSARQAWGGQGRGAEWPAGKEQDGGPGGGSAGQAALPLHVLGPSPSSAPSTEEGPGREGGRQRNLLPVTPRRTSASPSSHPLCAGSAPAGQTPGGPGPRLSQLSVTDVTTSSLRLNWEAPPGAFDSFLLRYGVPSASAPEPHPRPLLQREVTVPGTQLSAVLRDLRPGTLYSLTLYGLRGPHQADSVQGTARTLSPGEPGSGG